jgi:hypothetical protein
MSDLHDALAGCSTDSPLSGLDTLIEQRLSTTANQDVKKTGRRRAVFPLSLVCWRDRQSVLTAYAL